MKKFFTVFLSAILSFCPLFAFVGCKEEVGVGPIPNGTYIHNCDLERDWFVLWVGNNNSEYYLEIEGDNVDWYVSNSLDYKAKIVEKGGKIYFEGYKWASPISFFECQKRMVGRETIYEVVYDKEAKTITIDYYTSQDT